MQGRYASGGHDTSRSQQITMHKSYSCHEDLKIYACIVALDCLHNPCCMQCTCTPCTLRCAPHYAAGLLYNTRYHGRKTPLKGKGTPPPDNFEPQFHPSKRLVPGKSHVAVK